MGAAVATEQNHFLILRAAMLAPARTITWMGRTFRVVPAVLVRAQVLNNNLGRTYLPADEITDDWADAWNGIPVLVGPHPSMRGAPSSGRNPELWNERGVGFIFKARAEAGPDGNQRLAAEVRLDVGRADHVPGLQAVLDALDAGQPVELSTGFATRPEEQAGNFNGQHYDWVLHPVNADHLVISTEMTGACSVADGCGLGVNCQCGGTCMESTEAAAAAAATANDAPMQDGHPASDFAYAVGNPSEWKLPIYDAAHVRAALARFNQTQLPANARAGAWRKIMRACDRFNIEVSDRTMPSMNEDAPTGLRAVFAKVIELFTAPKHDGMTPEEATAANTVRWMAEHVLTPSDQERAQMLKEALQEKYGDSTREVCVCDVYTEPTKSVIFWFMTPMGAMPKGCEYYRASWADTDNDGIPEITQTGDPELVRRQTTYEPVAAGPAGDGAGAGAAYAGSSAGAANADPAPEPEITAQPQEDGAMEDTKEVVAALAKLSAAIEAINTKVETISTKVVALESSDATVAGLKKTISALADKVDATQALTAPAVQERERERTNLVQKLAGHYRVPFSQADLEAKPLEELRKIEAMADATNFSGRGGPQGVDTEQKYVEPVKYWEKPGASAEKK